MPWSWCNVHTVAVEALCEFETRLLSAVDSARRLITHLLSKNAETATPLNYRAALLLVVFKRLLGQDIF